MGRGLVGVFEAVGAGDSSEILASRTLVSSFAALGFGALSALATSLGVGVSPRIALLAVALLATSNIIASAPESYGISFGLLAASAMVIWSDLAPRRKAAALVVLTVLCAGSTITNAVYPAVALLYLCVRHPDEGGLRPDWISRRRIRQLAIACGVATVSVIGLLCIAFPIIGQRFPNLKSHLLGWLHFRIYYEPLRTVGDWLVGIVYPVVSPYPSVQPGRISFSPETAVTWTWVHFLAAMAWASLIVCGLTMGVRDRKTRMFTLGLVGWVGFNLAIHSVWGGSDNFLYSPHWSWALMAIGFMAARGSNYWPAVAACIAILPAQIMTIRWISTAISSQ
jgi:hypothetical protein